MNARQHLEPLAHWQATTFNWQTRSQAAIKKKTEKNKPAELRSFGLLGRGVNVFTFIINTFRFVHSFPFHHGQLLLLLSIFKRSTYAKTLDECSSRATHTKAGENKFNQPPITCSIVSLSRSAPLPTAPLHTPYSPAGYISCDLFWGWQPRLSRATWFNGSLRFQTRRG